MTKPKISRRSFLKDESGAGAIEYGLVIGVTALVVSFSAGGLGVSVNDLFEVSSEKVEEAADCAETGSKCKKKGKK